jgi:ubiquinone/menaquinone biosynthesis C-methylase UbiE
MVKSWTYPGDVYEIIRRYHRKLPLEISFLESYGLVAGKKYLDIGCATGVLIREFSNRGVECVGIDSSQEFIRFGKAELTAKSIQNAKMHESTIQDFVIQQDEFDFVTCVFNTISYLDSYDDIESAIKKVRLGLKRGGTFVLEFAFYLNFIGSFKDSMTINHFDDDLKVTRLIKHSINPHRAIWNHEETLLVQRREKQLETYFESQPQIVVLPPAMEQMLRRAGFEKIEFWGTWDKGRQVVGHSTCIAVAS